MFGEVFGLVDVLISIYIIQCILDVSDTDQSSAPTDLPLLNGELYSYTGMVCTHACVVVYCICVHTCAHVRVCVRICVRVCVRICVHVCMLNVTEGVGMSIS